MKKKLATGLAALVLFSSVLVRCSSSPSAGPVDGTYNYTAWTCGPKDLLAALKANGVLSLLVALTDTTGTVTIAINASCNQIQAVTFAYPSATSISATNGATTCSSGCTAGQCTAGPAPTPATVMTYNYSMTSTVLTFTRTLATTDVSSGIYPLVGCTAGQTETLTLAKQ